MAGLGVATVVDNTTAGALLQRPLDLGATYALTSATKQMSGHADLMLGYVTSREAFSPCPGTASDDASSP